MDPETSTHPIEEIGPLGEIRVDRGVLRVDLAGSVEEIAEKWAKVDGPVAEGGACGKASEAVVHGWWRPEHPVR